MTLQQIVADIMSLLCWFKVYVSHYLVRNVTSLSHLNSVTSEKKGRVKCHVKC